MNASFESGEQRDMFRKLFDMIKAFKQWYDTNLSNDLKKAFDEFNMVCDNNQRKTISMFSFVSAFKNYVNQDY